jgi:hypothetical protein
MTFGRSGRNSGKRSSANLAITSSRLPCLPAKGLFEQTDWQERARAPGKNVIRRGRVGLPKGAKSDARLALAGLAEPSSGWNAIERDAWSAVLEIADTTAPLAVTELGPLLAKARETVETVACRFHPEAPTAWAQFSLPEFLLLAERLSRDIRRESLRHIPAVETIRLSHLL